MPAMMPLRSTPASSPALPWLGGAFPSRLCSGTRGAAFGGAPAGTMAIDKSGGAGAGAFDIALASPSAGLVSSRAMMPEPVLPAGPAVKALACIGAASTLELPSRLGRGTSMERTAPNFSASNRMSVQISRYWVSSESSSMVTTFFKNTTLLGMTRWPNFCTLATKPISMTSSGFLTLSLFAPSSRPSSAARACCCVIMSAYSKNATPTDLPSSSFCSAKNFSWPNVMRSSRILSSVTKVGMFTRHSR
mmetsp:Transcript_30286/g.85418  ORF Transcript_30286/g.85418 Transcript_30286/m.85418 type:complete len:248 (+) Transcript_30286:320-1063(+)